MKINITPTNCTTQIHNKIIQKTKMKSLESKTTHNKKLQHKRLQ